MLSDTYSIEEAPPDSESDDDVIRTIASVRNGELEGTEYKADSSKLKNYGGIGPRRRTQRMAKAEAAGTFSAPRLTF